MKKLLTGLFILFSIVAYSQDFAPPYNSEFIGEWQGTVTRQDDSGETTVMRFAFYKSEHTGKLVCNRMFSNDAGNLYKNVDDNFTFVYEENSAVYTWVNAGGVWTEIQSFMFTIVDNGIQIVHTRWVNNDKEDGHQIWGYMQTGILVKD